jgi:Flp pilus assembly protein TadB
VAWWGATLLLAELRWTRRPSLQQRLASFAPRRAPLPDRHGGLLSVESFREVIGPLARAAGERLTRLLGVAEPLEVRLRRLGPAAGVMIDPTVFRLRQLGRSAAAGTLVLAGSVALGVPPVAAVGLTLGAPLLVFLIVEQRLIAAGERRRQQLRDELPVVAEQIGMLLAAGYSLGAALARVARRSSGACGEGLQEVGNRVRQGLSHADALREWADLVDLDELHRLVAVLQLQQEAGDLGRLIAEEARSMRREAQRRLVEVIERRAQLVWIPVTVATLLPGVLLMAVPFVAAMRTWSAL